MTTNNQTNPEGTQELRKAVNEILRRHDHNQDAQDLDVEYLEAIINTRIAAALEKQEADHLRFLAAILYQLGGRFELRKSSLVAVPKEFSISRSDIVPGIEAMILTLEESESALRKEIK